jgi:hypothetical protein
LIDQHFDQSNSEQTNEESENAAVGLTEVSAEPVETVPTTVEDDTALDTPVNNSNIGVTNDSEVTPESQVNVEDENQVAKQETVEQVENTESDLVEPVQTVEEVVSDTEIEQLSQNEQENDQIVEVEQEQSNQNLIKDKLIGYYQDLVASFSSFMNFIK